jgi:tetratricopeptide (TPR) repeat protein
MVLICFALALVTGAVYWQVRRFEFVNYDDLHIFFDEPMVKGGLTWAGIVWGATTFYYEYWHPLMWWSHMLDCQLFGLNAGPHHLVSAGIHVANTVLLFITVRRMTGFVWRSAVVAGLFGLHPLHVESVAWLAERKDVLSAFFWILSMWAYVRYAQSRAGPTAGKSSEPKPLHDAQGAYPKQKNVTPVPVRKDTIGWERAGVRVRNSATSLFWLSLLFFLLGLLTKPMVVTLPFVLLLMDYWPLGRVPGVGSIGNPPDFRAIGKSILRLTREKWPFFILTGFFCFMTWYSVKEGGHFEGAPPDSWGQRLSVMPVAYAAYLEKTLLPINLAPLYERPESWPWWHVVWATLVIVGITGLVIVLARRAGYLVFGWFAFLGILVPTIGIVQVGLQYIADRYMYLPSIGLFVASVWAVADISRRWRGRKFILTGLATACLAACAYLTWVQVGTWRNSVTLWQHCLAAGAESPIAHYDLGGAYLLEGKTDIALEQYQAALRLNTNSPEANYNYGTALNLLGRSREASNYLAKALELRPDYVEAHQAMGSALVSLQDYSGAMMQFNEALRLRPNNYVAEAGMGTALSALGQTNDAIDWFKRALDVNPAYAQGHYQLGREELKDGQFDDGVAHMQQAEELSPDALNIPMELAAAFAGAHQVDKELAAYQRALKVNPDQVVALNNLAFVLATTPDASLRNGAEAVRLASHACDLTGYKQTVFVGTLAAAYAEAGQFDKAVPTAQQACALAKDHGEAELLKKNQDLLALYHQGKPFHKSE